MPHPTQQAGTRWKLGLLLLVLLFLCAMATSFVLAARRGSRVVDADYYSHGLHYGEDQAKNAGNAWTITPALDGAELLVEVKDQVGAPVAGGKLSFEPLANDSKARATLQLAESAPGMFRTPRPGAAGGELRGTLRFVRGQAVACRKLVLFN